jgi:hypothetical protein
MPQCLMISVQYRQIILCNSNINLDPFNNFSNNQSAYSTSVQVHCRSGADRETADGLPGGCTVLSSTDIGGANSAGKEACTVTPN